MHAHSHGRMPSGQGGKGLGYCVWLVFACFAGAFIYELARAVVSVL